MSENPGQGGGGITVPGTLLDHAIGALSGEGRGAFQRSARSAPPATGNAEGERALTRPPVTAFDRVGLSVTVGATRRFAMTVSGRIDGPAGGPGFDPTQAQAVCTISDRHAPDEPPLQGALKMADDGHFTFTVLLEAWPEERYPAGRLFVITVRARDRAGTLGESTTYLRIPPAAPAPTVPLAAAKRARAAVAVPDALLAEAAKRPRPIALPLYVKGLHLAVKELRDERKPGAARDGSVR